MKKTVLKILILSLCIVLAIGTISYAGAFKNDVETAINGLKNNNSGLDNAEQERVANFTYTVLRVVTVAGSIIGTIMLIVFGIKWMIANPTKKATLKEESWSYVLGALFLFGAGPLAQLVYNAISKINQ